MITVKFERCAPDDPNRCQHHHAGSGQCPFKALEGKTYCPRHANITGGSTLNNRENVRLYSLTKWQSLYERHADNPKLKTIQDEIGIARMMLESYLNKFKDETELLMHAGVIIELTSSINQLVQTALKIDKTLGAFLSKEQAIALIKQIAEVVAPYVGDPEMIQMMAEDMESLVNTTFENNRYPNNVKDHVPTPINYFPGTRTTLK